MPDLVPVLRRAVPARREHPSPPPPDQLPATQPSWQPRPDFFSEFDELWDRMVGRFFGPPLAWHDRSGEWMPAVDLEETPDSWIFEIDLPGARRDDLRVEIGNSELEVSGTIGERQHAGVVRRRGRRSGSFQYRTTLPADVDADKVTARFDNGVLTVTVPRPEHARTRRIRID